jgi:hypothetical protein
VAPKTWPLMNENMMKRQHYRRDRHKCSFGKNSSQLRTPMRKRATCFPVLLQFGALRRWTLASGHVTVLKPYRRHSSAQAMATDSKAFSKTLLLPKTSFPLWADPSKSEAPFRKRTGEDLYRWQVLSPLCDTSVFC